MTRLSLAFADFKQRYSISNIFFDVDRVQIRKDFRKLKKTDTKEQKLLTKDIQDLNKAASIGERETVSELFEKICNDNYSHLKDEIEILNNLLVVIMRQFNELRKHKEEAKNLGDKEFESAVATKMKKIHDETLVWFQAVQRRERLTVYMSDVKTLHHEIEHILDPFNLQRNIRSLNKNSKKLSSAVSAAKKRLDIAKKRKSNEYLSKDFKIDKKQYLLYQEAYSKNLDDVQKKLSILWQDFISSWQQEVQQDALILSNIIKTLELSKFPVHELNLLRIKAKKLHDESEKLGNELLNQINSLEIIERTQ